MSLGNSLFTPYTFTANAVTLVVFLPLQVNSIRNISGLLHVSLSVAVPPAVSKLVQVPGDCPVWLHVFVPGDTVVVSTQSSDRVLIGVGQYNL